MAFGSGNVPLIQYFIEYSDLEETHKNHGLQILATKPTKNSKHIAENQIAAPSLFSERADKAQDKL